MLNRIIHFSIHHRAIIGLAMLAWLAWGIYSLRQLPVDAVPDITNNQVQIITTAPALSASDVERLVTFPVEQAMLNIPELKEVRSISRFGLSVVTVVFDDATDIYWARQQVQERLAGVEVPPSIGKPAMAPLSTGLGEVYQYVLRPKKGYEQQYDAMQLRTLQDWVVRRQLLGTPGVADVSGFGGYLKQYEIALNPQKLRSFGLTIADIARAVEMNNQNAGSAYIEKGERAYFIRSEGLLQSLDELKQICVGYTAQGLPILLKEVAEVRWGHAVRYGALTYNDRGEAVGGIVMMLKGENAAKVIERVKERLQQIQRSLPEGVVIEPYLDRTQLVNRTIRTVVKNLTEGALIVIAVIMLLLGSLRAGLVVASVIPLSMLFAIGMMNVFGISGNLMSLGAIDFGIIVDGSIIIVEAGLHYLHTHFLNKRLPQQEMNEAVFRSAVKVRNAAAFGEIIIMIVYLPVLALSGVEGRMFKPMAATVIFAILGAFILSLTYVPMMSAWLFNKKIKPTWAVSARIVHAMQALYRPVLWGALRRRLLVVAMAVLLFVLSLWRFLQMGAELVPTLQEGDIAIQVTLLQGSSLQESVRQVSRISHILLTEFPEVRATVGKIGTAEIPTDPMPIEETDLMVLLHDRSTWTRFETQQELVAAIQQRLAQIPGLQLSFQQPIQLRFNELITGIRQDVAVKLYGENFDTLMVYGEKIAQVVQKVQGAKDLYVQRLGGMPQVVVSFDRQALARYGIDIATANQSLQAASAGWQVGQIYEEERRFDIVLRYAEPFRQSPEALQEIYLHSKDGQMVPLSKVARIEQKESLNEIRRDNARRFLSVAFNVRGRDIASVVEEVEKRIAQEVKLPPGYSLTFGGQFQTLQEAQNRLMIAVPLALALIFILLYFTFRSFADALLIFSAVPLAAIGGVWGLSLRNMPFSISAGVGFIALFGIAVLNGIVLIAEFRHLKTQYSNLWRMVLIGSLTRLRPVMTTALVASMGFLPMALSQSDGAEVQRPLATVVIFGLMTATVLTLVLLPCLYTLKEQGFGGRAGKRPMALMVMIFVLSLLSLPSKGQSLLQRQELPALLHQQEAMQAAEMQTRAQEWQAKNWAQLPRLQIEWMGGQYNAIYWDNYFAIRQELPLLWQLKARKAHAHSTYELQQRRQELLAKELLYQAMLAYEEVLYERQVAALYDQAAQVTDSLLYLAARAFEKGEISGWQYNQWQLSSYQYTRLRREHQKALRMASAALALYAGKAALPADSLAPWQMPAVEQTSMHPYEEVLQAQLKQEEAGRQRQRAEWMPSLNLGYFNQSLTGWQGAPGQERFYDAGKRFQGVMLTLSFPFINSGLHKQQQANKAAIEARKLETAWQQKQWKLQKEEARRQLLWLATELNKLQPLYELQQQQLQRAAAAYARGELDRITFYNHRLQALSWLADYYTRLYEYNRAVISWHYYANTLEEALNQF
ncbi:CusA/CzcA family heavy metal efflux RND transporter [Thermonema rossianum]|uniref:CusA/CzcA family heavy metal efflux RND transporter n=1 Tax=Thermonema rossianum TaxID=55505 RepID=UPI0008FFB8C5|nr:CusA/CzcA family heavy metal efflux RND transporter [Thermonema rossianum]